MKSRRGGGGSQFDHRYYTPLYETGKKKIENKSMETSNGLVRIRL